MLIFQLENADGATRLQKPKAVAICDKEQGTIALAADDSKEPLKLVLA
jgi:hypothetical protein